MLQVSSISAAAIAVLYLQGVFHDEGVSAQLTTKKPLYKPDANNRTTWRRCESCRTSLYADQWADQQCMRGLSYETGECASEYCTTVYGSIATDSSLPLYAPRRWGTMKYCGTYRTPEMSDRLWALRDPGANYVCQLEAGIIADNHYTRECLCRAEETCTPVFVTELDKLTLLPRDLSLYTTTTQRTTTTEDNSDPNIWIRQEGSE